jgi:hypothetical protein
MRYGSILVIILVCGLMLLGCSQTQVSRARIIEPSYSYTQPPVKNMTTGQTLAQLPRNEHISDQP